MKRIVLSIAAFLLLGPAPATGLTIDFNNLVPTNGFISRGVDGVYSVSAFTFRATGGTEQFSLDPGYDVTNVPPDNTDFETFEAGAASWTLSSGAPFALVSFQSAAIYRDPANTLTVTGHVSGGGTVVQVYNLPAWNTTAQWNTYTLPGGWTNLTSADFVYSGEFVGLDNVVVTGGGTASATPVPSVSSSGLLALMLLLAGMSAALLRRKLGR